MCHDTQGLRFFLITKKPKRAKNVLPCKKSAKMLKRFSVLPVFSFLLSPLPSFPHTFLLFPEPNSLQLHCPTKIQHKPPKPDCSLKSQKPREECDLLCLKDWDILTYLCISFYPFEDGNISRGYH